MKPVRLYLLSCLYDHLHRIAGPKNKNAANVAYLVVAREIAELYLPGNHSILYYLLTSRLFDIEQSVAGTDKVPSEYLNAWLCLKVTGTYCKKDCMKAIDLVGRLCGKYDWASYWKFIQPKSYPLASNEAVNRSLLATLFEVACHFDAPLMFARDSDLLRFQIWFGGDLSEEMEPFYVRLFDYIDTDSDYEALLNKYPVNGNPPKYMWRCDHEPCLPVSGNTLHKNISILDLEMYSKHCVTKLSNGDNQCVVFTSAAKRN